MSDRFPMTIDDVRALHPGRQVIVCTWPAPGWAACVVTPEDPNEVASDFYMIQDDRDVAEQAAFWFHLTAMRTLFEARGPTHLTAVARIVGESPSNYHDAALTMSRGGSLDRVNRWIRRWNDSGLPALALVVTGPAAYVAPARWAWVKPNGGHPAAAAVGATPDQARERAGVAASDLTGRHPDDHHAGFPAPVVLGVEYDGWTTAFGSMLAPALR